jgi:GWxTD domain-containing protein
MKKSFVVLALLVAIPLSISVAQRLTPKSPLILNLDYAKFRNSDSTGYLEIYYGFYPSLASYEMRDGHYSGLLIVSTRVRDAKGGAILVNNRSAVPIVVADTNQFSRRSTLVSVGGYVLPFGDYTLDVVVTDSLNQSRKDSIALPVKVLNYGNVVGISDLELCSNIKSSEEKNDLFYKNSLEVLPNPTLVFGVASHPMMFNYAEIYNLDSIHTYSIKSQVIGADGAIVKETAKSRKYKIKNAVEAGTTNVASIPSGKYRFRLTFSDEAGTVLAEREKSFYLYNPHIKGSQKAASSIKATELAGMSAEELADEFRKAQYIATDQEVRTFSQISSEEGRREFLAKFWTEVENGRLGQAPMTRMVYLQRVLAASQRFHALNRDGWRTDRGRVFVLYGEPDEIERFPSSQEAKPYENWHYYSIENGVEFIFIDRSGFGEYILVHSTKRGELRDDDWQRFLQ